MLKKIIKILEENRPTNTENNLVVARSERGRGKMGDEVWEMQASSYGMTKAQG